ncbi:MAG: response regulator [Candidatus Omnitrophica bacterium]|nr:response regulator [Candidatus Omnitrophota bacterium]
MSAPAELPRLLIVDDDEPTLNAYRALFAPKGFAVTTCSESAEVLPLLAAGTSYRAVLLDIRMPGWDGTDLLPQIKRLHPDLPVMLVSAYCDPEHADYYRQLGADAALPKPFSAEVLLETLERVTGRQEQIPLVLRSLSLKDAREQVTQKLMLAALARTGWNQVQAAKLLGVSRYCLMRWMKKLKIADAPDGSRRSRKQ